MIFLDRFGGAIQIKVFANLATSSPSSPSTRLASSLNVAHRRPPCLCHCHSPGLIDAHTHVLLQGDVTSADYDVQLLKQSPAFRAILATRSARLGLGYGFTTIRDIETEGAGYADSENTQLQAN